METLAPGYLLFSLRICFCLSPLKSHCLRRIRPKIHNGHDICWPANDFNLDGITPSLTNLSNSTNGKWQNLSCIFFYSTSYLLSGRGLADRASSVISKYFSIINKILGQRWHLCHFRFIQSSKLRRSNWSNIYFSEFNFINLSGSRDTLSFNCGYHSYTILLHQCCRDLHKMVHQRVEESVAEDNKGYEQFDSTEFLLVRYCQ